jgi:cell division protein ZapE
MPGTLLDQYRARSAAGEIEVDPAQIAAVERLDKLSGELARWNPSDGGLLRMFRRPAPPPRGLYIHGAVGRGKTMLMDMFFASAPVARKRRVHFHEFMADVHDRLTAARKTVRESEDPITAVGRSIADEAALLAFDELHVTDIADAMILGRLFKTIFEQPVVVVATSNAQPVDLYLNGLNRQLFLPFIDLVEDHMDVLELKAAKDFRLVKLAGRPLYFVPADGHATAEMDRLWTSLTGGSAPHAVDLDVKGHKVHVPRAAMGVARCNFEDLCVKPLSALDFLHIAHAFHTILLEGVPVFGRGERDVTRRFINLIDTLYDNHVCLAVSAAAEPDALYPSGDMAFLFERTASRLIEMRSESYLTERARRREEMLAGPLPG